MTRWQVIVVRPPTDEAKDQSLPASGSGLFPLSLARTADPAEAEQLAERLRARGATVAVLEEHTEAPVTCEWHPPQLLGRTCRECGVGVCALCRLEAGGDRLCPVCRAHREKRRRAERVRQLFAVFLFSVFLYQVVAWQREEADRLDPAQGISVAVFQFVAPGTADAPMVRALNDVDGPFALLRIPEWYDREYARFTGATRGFMNLRTFGPWRTPAELPALAAEGAPAWEDAWAAWRYAAKWHALAEAHGVDPGDWDVRVYVVYERGAGDIAAESRGSDRGRIAVSRLDLDDPNYAYPQLTVAHEMGHVLGGEDLYDPDTYLAQAPRGLAEPHRKPLYPQRYAEVMAGDRPQSPQTEAEVRSLDEVRVGYHTAARFGWIEPEQATLHYTPRRDVIFGPPEAEPAPAPPPEPPAAPTGDPASALTPPPEAEVAPAAAAPTPPG